MDRWPRPTSTLTRPPVQANQARLAPIRNGVVSLVRSALNRRPGGPAFRAGRFRAAQTPRSRLATSGAFGRWRRPGRHSCGVSPRGVDHHDPFPPSHRRSSRWPCPAGPPPAAAGHPRHRPKTVHLVARPAAANRPTVLASTRRRAPGLLLRPRDDSPARRRAGRRPAGAPICRFDRPCPVPATIDIPGSIWHTTVPCTPPPGLG